MKLRSLFIQDDGPRPPAGRAETRLARIPTYDLSAWAEQCLYAAGRNLSEFSKDPARRECLDEAVEAADLLYKTLVELRQRTA